MSRAGGMYFTGIIMTRTSGYWRFYWPLALTGLVHLFAQQLQNGALARYPNATRELATFALAAGAFHLFDAALIFIPQMVTVLARSKSAARKCLRFTLVVCVAMTIPPVLLAIRPLGGPVLAALFHVTGETLSDIMLYMALLSPNIIMTGLRQYCTGLLIQAKRTGTVTMLNVSYLAVVLVMLVIGMRAGWRAVFTLAIAQLSGGTFHLVFLWFAAARCAVPGGGHDKDGLTYRDVFDFFWPVALTSVMFSLSRPILYSFLARLPDPQPVIASMRVGFDFAMIFHNLLNQFRHLFVAFGERDLPGVRRFMVRVTVIVVGSMIVVVITPIAGLILRDLIGIEAEILVMSRQVLMVMCLLPAVVTFRNYFHGLAMIRRRTGPMGAGAVARNIATYLVSVTLFAAGLLNHMTAAGILIIGFLAETLVVIISPVTANAVKKRWDRTGEDVDDEA